MAVRRQRQRQSAARWFLLWLLLLTCLAAAGFLLLKPLTGSIYHKLYPQKYSSYVEQYSREYGVDPNLVYAVCKVESNFDPQAVSSADARGLMQLTRDAFDWVEMRMGWEDIPSSGGYDQIFEPKVAVQHGTYMLRLLIDQMGSEYLAICAYHAGASNVRAWLEQEAYSKDGVTIDQIPYSDTAWYVDEVFAAKERYEALY